MDFDPKPSTFTSQDEIFKYLMRYCDHLPSMIKVEFCHSGTDVKEASSTGGVYFHPQILALGVQLPLTRFVRDVPGHLQVAPTQLAMGAWRTVLAFEAPYRISSPSACGFDEFCSIYMMVKTKSRVRFFKPRKDWQKLIVNLVDSDHGWSSP